MPLDLENTKTQKRECRCEESHFGGTMNQSRCLTTEIATPVCLNAGPHQAFRKKSGTSACSMLLLIARNDNAVVLEIEVIPVIIPKHPLKGTLSREKVIL